MRSRIFSGPLGGFGKTSRLGSANGWMVKGCNEYELALGDFWSGVFSGAAVFSFEGEGIFKVGTAGGWYCDMPAATAVLVCMHRKNGLECMTILRFFLGRCRPSVRALSACGASSLLKSRCARSASLAASGCSMSRWCRSAAIRRPSAFPCDQPPYVRGGS
jgi:hypothetical protein